MNIAIQGLTESDLTKRFNSYLINVLISKEEFASYIEFMNLCIFYKKVNSTNALVIQQIINLNRDYLESESYIKNFVPNLLWDVEDELLYNFMTCFLNL